MMVIDLMVIDLCCHCVREALITEVLGARHGDLGLTDSCVESH